MRCLRGHSEDTSMKVFAILPVAAVAILGLNIVPASSQKACQAEYMACMDYCGARSSKTIQDTCFTSCESKNNMCAERVYGKRPFNGGPSSVAEQKGQAKDALAKTDKVPDAPQEPAAAEEAPQKAVPQIAPQRGSAKR
jgi:hypothetical protein